LATDLLASLIGVDAAIARISADNGCILRMTARRSDMVACVAGRRYGCFRATVMHP
jgi:hypothetical protein